MVCPFAGGDTRSTDTGSEEQVAESVDNEAIDFLGHGDIERASACHDMCQPESSLLGYDSGSHRRCQVVNNDDGVHRVTVEIVLEGCHHLSRQFIQILTVNT